MRKVKKQRLFVLGYVFSALIFAIIMGTLVTKNGGNIFGFSQSKFKPLKGDYWNPSNANVVPPIKIKSNSAPNGQLVELPIGKVDSEKFLSENADDIVASLELTKHVPIKITLDKSIPSYYPLYHETGLSANTFYWLGAAAITLMEIGNYESARQYIDSQLLLYEDLSSRPNSKAQRICILYRENFHSMTIRYLSSHKTNKIERLIIQDWVDRLLENQELSVRDYIEGVTSEDLSSPYHASLLKLRYEEGYKSRKMPVPRFSPSLAEEVIGEQTQRFGSAEEPLKDWSYVEAKTLAEIVTSQSHRNPFYLLPKNMMRASLDNWFQFDSIIESYFEIACVDIYIDYLNWTQGGRDAGDWVPKFGRYSYDFIVKYEWVRPHEFFGETRQDESRGGLLFSLIDEKGEPWPASYSGKFLPFSVETDLAHFFGPHFRSR